MNPRISRKRRNQRQLLYKCYLFLIQAVDTWNSKFPETEIWVVKNWEWLPFICAEKQTTTEEKSVSLEMESLGQLNVSSKSIDIGSIWNEAFLNRVWSKNHGRKRINAHKNAKKKWPYTSQAHGMMRNTHCQHTRWQTRRFYVCFYCNFI